MGPHSDKQQGTRLLSAAFTPSAATPASDLASHPGALPQFPLQNRELCQRYDLQACAALVSSENQNLGPPKTVPYLGLKAAVQRVCMCARLY